MARVRDVSIPDPVLDPRAVRFGQAVVAVALLASFVFQQPVGVPVTAVVVALGVAFGPGADPLRQVFDTIVAPRLAPPTRSESRRLVRLGSLVVVVVLTLATAAFTADIGAIGWLLALAVAGVSAIAATTGTDLVRRMLLGLQRRAED
ncbi:MAG TPA: DUF4395 family protein [Acidimicrobiia bacterium]|nr:DUF4395 family protein [Acidimicrobiia bacterium]